MMLVSSLLGILGSANRLLAGTQNGLLESLAGQSSIPSIEKVEEIELPWGAELFGASKKLTDGPILRFSKTPAVVYKRTDQYELKCDVFVPEGDGPFPAILAVHGGGWRGGSKFHMSRHAWLMARSGYVVVAIDYRLAPEHPFPAQLEDCRDAVMWMKANAKRFKMDVRRLGAYGYSAGAHLVALTATTENDDPVELPDGTKLEDTRIKAVAVGGAPCEFSWVGDSNLLSFWLGGTRKSKPEAYFEASPIHFVSVDDPAFYFYHGQYDPIVPWSSGWSMHQRLCELGIESRFDTVKNGEHFFPFSRLEYMQRGIRFFNRHLNRDRVQFHDADPKSSVRKKKAAIASGGN